MKLKSRVVSAFALFLLAVCSGATVAAESDIPKISHMRFEGLKIEDNMYVPSSEFGREYKILVDFESQAPIARVLLQTRWADGKVGPVIERPFEVKLEGRQGTRSGSRSRVNLEKSTAEGGSRSAGGMRSGEDTTNKGAR